MPNLVFVYALYLTSGKVYEREVYVVKICNFRGKFTFSKKQPHHARNLFFKHLIVTDMEIWEWVKSRFPKEMS